MVLQLLSPVKGTEVAKMWMGFLPPMWFILAWSRPFPYWMSGNVASTPLIHLGWEGCSIPSHRVYANYD